MYATGLLHCPLQKGGSPGRNWGADLKCENPEAPVSTKECALQLEITQRTESGGFRFTFSPTSLPPHPAPQESGSTFSEDCE